MTARPIIRNATSDDAAAVTKLLAASYPVLMATAYDPATLAAALPLITEANPKLLAGGTCFVAVVRAQIVGVGGWSLYRPGTGAVEPGVAHIRQFATHPHWTGQGVGRAIYQACETAARGAGATGFECQASRNAVPFYTAVGFAAVRDIDVPLTPEINLPAVLMTRRI